VLSEIAFVLIYLLLSVLIAYDIVLMAAKKWGDHLKTDVPLWVGAMIAGAFIITGIVQLLAFVTGHLSGRL